MPPRALLITLVVAGCGGSATPVFDGSADGLAGATTLCTNTLCAAAPCTPRCPFTLLSGGKCPDATPVQVDKVVAAACPGFCGFLAVAGHGCLRFRAESAACTGACDPWSVAACFEQNPPLDYKNGAAICETDKGFACYRGIPGDMGAGRDCGMPDMASADLTMSVDLAAPVDGGAADIAPPVDGGADR